MAKGKKPKQLVDQEIALAQSQIDVLNYQVDIQALQQQLDSALRYGVDLAHNRICFDGIIDEYSLQWVAGSLATLEAKGAPEISLDLCSYGGHVHEALAILGRMRASPVPVNVRVFGTCCSAATILLAGATGKRQISAFAEFMHHEASWGTWGRTSSNRDELQKAEHDADRWAKWMARFTKKPASYWKKLDESRRDNWFDPEECVKLGVADEII
jgi:ATP-dependent protease ClpP protease subunit